MFYVGDKYKLIEEIRKYFPGNIDNFIEPFVGGGSVFLNVRARRYIINDINKYVYGLHHFLQKSTKNDVFFTNILEVLVKQNLSHSFVKDVVGSELKQKYKKTYYAKYNKQGYIKLKNEFNKSKEKDYNILYILLIYGFNRILRFNAKGEYNVPVGNVDFNKNVEVALNNYFDFVKENKIQLRNLDFNNFLMKQNFKENDFIYLDPPYLITSSEYNKIWNEKKELELLNLLDKINKKNVKFAISNVIRYKGMKNQIFLDWMKKYKYVKIKSNYISYHDNSNKDFIEVLVFNY